jgi:hypothetical protein
MTPDEVMGSARSIVEGMARCLQATVLFTTNLKGIADVRDSWSLCRFHPLFCCHAAPRRVISRHVGCACPPAMRRLRQMYCETRLSPVGACNYGGAVTSLRSPAVPQLLQRLEM